MKKNISLVNLDFSLAEWLVKNLLNVPENVLGGEELSEALVDLTNGESSSLMLEMEKQEQKKKLDRGEISYGGLSVFPSSHRVIRDEQEIKLTPKEFSILLLLLQNRGEVFTKEQIYRAVWDDEYLMDDSNIMAFIRKLRKKIEPNPDSPKYILTIWGLGYKFNDKL